MPGGDAKRSMRTGNSHDMPFGALPVAGGVKFRLWAPAAQSVELLLYDGGLPQRLPMAALPGGWYELLTNQAHVGSRYRYRIDSRTDVPDPAARASDGPVGASVVVDPLAHAWRSVHWRGRPWHEAVIYELHVGAFTPAGTFAMLASRLEHLVRLGVTVIELMPVADFPGTRGWGYDGVLPFAPYSGYGSPDQLKSFVDAAHERGLAVMLDVVYNHFGPEGNWLHAYAPQFFTARHRTPWGDAVNFDDRHSDIVRSFFIHNALYWLAEFQFDGLRVDAVHAMRDDSGEHFIHELVRKVRAHCGPERHVHLVLENHDNTASLLGPPGAADRADAQWNDDFHHCLHVVLTGERDGYYADFAHCPHAMLARCLAEDFSFQGEPSAFAHGRLRGERSNHLPPTAVVNFLQTHDQVGNRAFGERLHRLVDDEAALLAATAIMLLAPSPPLLFMGEEWAAPEPFLYFCDFEPRLAARVREGRRREFAAFARFSDPAMVSTIPDPTDPATFASVKLDWDHVPRSPHAAWLARYRELLAIRQRDIVPLVPKLDPRASTHAAAPPVIDVSWATHDGCRLRLIANLSAASAPHPMAPPGRVLYATHSSGRPPAAAALEPWSVRWLLDAGA
jgi:malto-oligosyltrehalose trehalohydrolase